MSYYNRDCQKFEQKDMKHLECGACGQVLYNTKITFKTYFSDTPISGRLSPKMFDILKDMDNPHFIKLFDIYRDMNFLKLFRYKYMNKPFIVDAYTAKYYFEDKMNALYKSKDYILDNFRELETLFNLFTDNCISTDDVKRANCVLGTSKIVIIDPDSYKIASTSKEKLNIHNKKKLLNLFKSICINGIYDMPNYWQLVTDFHNQMENIEIEENIDVTSEIDKILKNVKRPIDHFIK